MTSTPSGSTGTRADHLTFVDTNVLVYAYDASEAIKQPRAEGVLEELWEAGTGVISTQILEEFYVVSTTKLKQGMSPDEARDIVHLYSAWTVVLIEPSLILTASRLHEQRRLSFWDALVVEAARAAGAGRLLTEDLHDGDDIDGVRVENPFR